VQARFWSLASGLPPVDDDKQILDGSRDLDDGESICLSDGGLRIWLTRPDEAPAVHGRVHVDLSGDRDFVQRLLVSGASYRHDFDHGVVLADPEGNEFCVEFVD